MSQPQHKYAQAQLRATLNLTRVEIAQIAQAVALQAHGSLWSGPGTARFEGSSASALNFSIQARGPLKRELMTFQLLFHDGAVGEPSQILVKIMTYKTVQQKVYGVVSVGKKQMLGYSAYLNFMQLLAAQINQRDSSASVSITGT